MAEIATDANGKILANRPASNTPYIIAIIMMVLIGAIMTLGVILLLPDKENTALITMIWGFLLPTTTGLLTFMKGQQIDNVVNSRMGDVEKIIRRAAFAEGIVEAGHRAAAAPVPVMMVTPVAAIAPPPVPAPSSPSQAIPIHSGDDVTVQKKE